MPRIARRVRLDFFLRRRESPHFAPRAASPRSRGARRSPRGAASRARASRMRVSSRALAPRDTARGARARRKRVGGGAVRAVSRSTARDDRREELVCYWDLDNMRPPCGVEVRRRLARGSSTRFVWLVARAPGLPAPRSEPNEPRVKRPGNIDVDHQKLARPFPWVNEFMRSRHSIFDALGATRSARRISSSRRARTNY